MECIDLMLAKESSRSDIFNICIQKQPHPPVLTALFLVLPRFRTYQFTQQF